MLIYGKHTQELIGMFLNIKIKPIILKIKKSGRGINYKKGKVVLLKCNQCKCNFWIPYSHGRQKFCNIKCYRKYLREHKFCLKYDFKKFKKYLTKEYVIKRKSQKEIAKDLKCTGGLISFYLKKFRIRTRSITEAKKGKSIVIRNRKSYKGKNNPNWKKGISKEPYPFKFNNKLKKQIRYRDDYKCQLCEMTNRQHKNKYNQNLLIHHIDYNKKNLKENNLITLCRKDNSIVNFKRKYWTGFFRNLLNMKFGYEY